MPPYTPAIARTAHRANVALPAAGALSAIADTTQYPAGVPLQVPAGIKTITAWAVYTRSAGKAGGAPAIGARVGNGTEEAREPVTDGAIDTGAHAGFGQQKIYARDLAPLPAAPSDAALAYPPITIDVQPGWFIWFQACEVGNVAFPGSLSIAITGAP